MKYLAFLILSLSVLSCTPEIEMWEQTFKYEITNGTDITLDLTFYSGSQNKDTIVTLFSGENLSWLEGIDVTDNTSFETFYTFTCDSIRVLGGDIDVLFWSRTDSEDSSIGYESSLNPLYYGNYNAVNVNNETGEVTRKEGEYAVHYQIKLDYDKLKSISK